MKILLSFIVLITPFITDAQINLGGTMPDFNNAPVLKLKEESSPNSTIIDSFNDSAKIIDHKHYSKKKGLVSHARYEYSSNDSIYTIREISLIGHRTTPFAENRYHYNKNKQLVKTEGFVVTSLQVTTEYFYAHGLLLSEKSTLRLKDTTESYITLYTYDNQQRLIRTQYIYQDSTHNNTITLRYNTKGQLTDNISENKQRGKKYHTVFEDIDAYGNWHKRYHLTDKEKTLLSSRQITYRK